MQTEEMVVRDNILVRPRINELLREAQGYPLCTVTAGTGYGKTRSVSAFMQEMTGRHVWVQLTGMDNYTEHFWEMLTHAMACVEKNIAAHMQRLGFPATPELLYKLVKQMQDALKDAEILHVVLDDFHKITQPAILRLVEALAEAQIDNLCIVLLSRQAVPLDYFSLYNNGLLHRITEEDYRFSYEEIAVYYSLLGFEFSPRMLTNIYETTEGWPMAIYLMGLHVAGGPVEEKDPIKCTMPFLNSLFEVEIFSGYTPAVQDAFVRLSLLEAIPQAIVKEIAGGSFSAVENALRENMFATCNPCVDNQYVFHRLFRRFLKPRRDGLPCEEKQRVYRLTADWCFDQGRHSEALGYYEQGKDYEGQWSVMQQYLKRDAIAETAAHCYALVEKFPPEFIVKTPMVLIHKGYLLLHLGRIDEAARCFEQVIRAMEGAGDEQAERLCGEAWLGLAPLRIYQRDPSFVQCYKNAIALLPDGSAYVSKANHYLGNSNALRVFSPEAGTVDEMATRLKELWPSVSHVMNGCGSGLEYLASAEAFFYRGIFTKALQSAHKALLMAVEYGQRDIACAAYYLLIRLHFATGNYDKVMQCLCEMDRYVRLLGQPHTWGVDSLAKAWFYQRVGDIEAIPDWIYSAPLDGGATETVVVVNREHAVELGCLIDQGRYAQALRRQDLLYNTYKRQGAIFCYLKTMVYKAICLLRLGREDEAAEAFLQTCREAMPNDIGMTLIEEGQDTLDLIGLVGYGEGEGPVFTAWLQRVENAARDYAAARQRICERYAASQKRAPL